MRDYGKVSPQFWVGHTGKALRGNLEAQIVALYLMTSPHANMIGVYYCPIDYIAKETGLTLEGASKALQCLIEADYCTYDEASEYVCVHRFAASQIGDELKPTDKRVQGVINELAKVPKNQCWRAFRARYAEAFHLPPLTGTTSPIEAPSKAPRSQKQKQEQKQKEGRDAPFCLPDWIPREPWDGYEAMRLKNKKPMTDRARDLVIRELEKLREQGQDVGMVLDRSTVKNWTDVYAVSGGQAAERPASLAGAI